MPVFARNTITGRKVKDPGTDKSLPDGKSLAYNAMTTVTALATTTGIDCKLVHGDRWQEIAGNMTELYDMNVTTTIDQNWTITVNGTMNLTVVQGYNEVQEGPVNETYYQAVTITNLDDQYQSIADSFAWTVAMASNTVTIVEQVSVVLGGQLNAVEGVQVNVVGLLCATAVVDFDLEYKTLHVELHPINGAWAPVDLREAAAAAELKASVFEMLSKVKITTEANAGVHISSITPLE
jgi:hypothetical protein